MITILKKAKGVYVSQALKVLNFYNWANRNNSVKIWQGKGQDTISKYLSDIERPDRELLVDKIASFRPISVLEIGCFVGVNLYCLARKIPEIKMVGIEPNMLAIEKGREWLNGNFCKNIQLAYGTTRDLFNTPNDSFDVVFTRAVLLHIGDKDIEQALTEMIRICKKSAVFLEWQDFRGELGDKEQGWVRGHWVRRYDKMIKRLCPTVEVRITPMLRDVWKEWNDHGGAYIEVIK